MRVAVVSDIHGNLTALNAVIDDITRRGVDQVVHGGDLALMGPRPAEVIDRIIALGWLGVLGNTDELLWRPEQRAIQLDRAPALADHLRLLFDAYAADTQQRIGEQRLRWLKQLPTEYRVEDLTLVHAAPDDLWRAPMPKASDDELIDTYGALDTAYAVYGHIHRPFARALGTMTVANTGSVGLPWDGDPRASYLLLDGGRPTIIRVNYDIDSERRALHESGHPDAERLGEMRRQAQFLRPG